MIYLGPAQIKWRKLCYALDFPRPISRDTGL